VDHLEALALLGVHVKMVEADRQTEDEQQDEGNAG
jgi:hypothetical protein